MTPDLDSLATALYVKTDDLLKESPYLAPWRPVIGIPPRLTDTELATPAVMQALLGFTSERRWIRHAQAHLRHLFPYLPGQSGYNRRLRKATDLIAQVNRLLATDISLVDRHRVGRRLHPGGMRPLPRNRKAMGPCRQDAHPMVRPSRHRPRLRPGAGAADCRGGGRDRRR